MTSNEWYKLYKVKFKKDDETIYGTVDHCGDEAKKEFKKGNPL